MTEDMYLSLAIELFEKGTWTKEVFIKRITLYAKEKNMDMAVIDEIIDRLTKPKGYTIEDKRKFLSQVTISGDELKYGDAVSEMTDEMVEKFYEMESETLNYNVDSFIPEIEINNEIHEEEVEENEVIDYNTKLFGNKSINDIIFGNYETSDLLGNSDAEKEVRFKTLIENVKEEDLKSVASSLAQKMKPSYCFYFRYEWDKLNKKGTELKESKAEQIVETIDEVEAVDNNKKVFGNKSINDIIYGNYTANDILGNNDAEREERFKYLIENVKVEDLRDVANSLIKKLEPSYCLNFTIEWEKKHNQELKKLETFEERKDEEKKEETVENVSNNNSSETKEEILEINEEPKVPKFIIPKLSFDEYGEDGLPTTEEEYKEQAENMNKTEKDSTVRKVNISPERLAKLKKTKDRAINCSLKTVMMILAFKLAGPIIAGGTVISYMYFAEEIRCGTFNPKNPVGKAIKYAVEKVMNIGIKKDKENERGMAK